jgi:tetratricopeptide (TPR) repeat protein
MRTKHSLGEARPRAQRQFTDREDFIAAFQSALQESRTDDPRVLVYYGVGGIGKTTLRKELSRQLETRPGFVWASLDFDLAIFREPEAALFALRMALQDGFKVQFPAFDIAYAAYWEKTRPQTPMTKENFPLLEHSRILVELVDLVGNLPVVGVIHSLAVIAARGGVALQQWWRKRGSTELRDLPGLEPVEIAERLPMFWAADLSDFLEPKDKRAVLFLDTHEALWEGERTEARVLHRDEWVRELVSQLPQVLWVICGRERLRWEELDPDWTKCLRQHLVGGLAEADVRQFLQSCGITEPAIQQVIVEGSQGVPYFLDLAVDTWVEVQERRKRAPTMADFARTPREMLDRFLRHLTQAEVETLKVLSALRHWDYSLFEALVKEFQTGYPLTAFDDLCRFSFVNEGATPDTWTMHQLMRQSLQENASQELVKRVQRFLFDYYNGQLKDIDIKGISDRQKAALAEAFYHGRSTLPAHEFFQWFSRPAEQFEQAAQWRLLIPLYEQVEHDLEAELGPEHPDVATSLNDLAELLHSQGKYAEAEPLYRRALAIREKILGSEHPDVADVLNNLAVLLKEQGKHAEAEPLYRRALAIYEKSLGPEHQDIAMSLNNLATLLFTQGRYAEAEPLYRRVLAICEKALGLEHPLVAMGLNNLASLLDDQGRHAEAEPLYRRALAAREKVLGPDHPDVASSLNNLARLLLTQGRHAEAEPLFRRALAIWERALGSEHCNVATGLNNLAKLLVAQGKCNEAEPLYQRSLAIKEKALGPEHPDVALSLNNLAALLQLQGKYAEAELLFRRALAIWEKALGSEHPNVAKALVGIAPMYQAQDRHAEAEPLLQRALAIREKALGSEHPDVAEVLENLAKLYDKTGRSEEAKSLEERAKQIRAKQSVPRS